MMCGMSKYNTQTVSGQLYALLIFIDLLLISCKCVSFTSNISRGAVTPLLYTMGNHGHTFEFFPN